MKPTINIDWAEKALELIGHSNVQEAAYKCGVSELKMKRISDGTTTRVDYDCGVLILWLLEQYK